MKKTVFLVINSLNGGGAERVASRLSEQWNEDYNLYIISIETFTNEDYKFFGTKISLNYNNIRKNKIQKNIVAIKELEQLCNKYKPDVMIAFLQKASLYTLSVSYKCKKIVSIRNYLKEKYQGIKLLVWEAILKKVYPKADYVVSVSREINKCMMKDYKIPKEKCVCIYNPYDIEKIHELSKNKMEDDEANIYHSGFVLCNVGHVSKQKGQIHLIRILPYLIKQIPNIMLVIVGKDNNEYGRKLKQLANELDVEKNVIFTGIKQNPYKIINNSDIFVFPSIFEGFPNALVEAMICKIPIIASDCKSGPREILDPNLKGEIGDLHLGKFGILVPNDKNILNGQITEQEKNIIDAIIKLYENEKLYKYYSSAGAIRAKEFSLDNIILKWKKIIEE